MNIFFDFGRLYRRQPKVDMVCLALALAVVAGCGKSGSTSAPAAPSSDSVSAPPPAATATPAAPVSADSQPVAQPGVDNTKKQLQTLNREMMGWMMKNHRRPQTFQEFANESGVQIPDPPAGKKYAFDSRGFIVLVNSTQ